MNRSLTPSFASDSDAARCWMMKSSALGLLMISLVNAPAKAHSDLFASVMIAQQIPSVPINRPTLKLGNEGAAVSELQAALKLLGYYTDIVDGVYRESTAIAVSVFQQAAGLTPDGITGPATWNRLFPSTPPTVVRTSPTPNSSNNPASVKPAPNSSNNPASVRPAPTSSNNPASSFPVPSIIQATNTNDRISTPAPEEPTGRRQGSRQTSNPSSSNPANSSQAGNSQTTAVTFPILKQGMQGPAVVQLQERLKMLGFLQSPVDGVFGEATQAAVKAAQQKFNLEPDGIVGPATWNVLLR